MKRRRGLTLDPRALLLVAACYATPAIVFDTVHELALLSGAGILCTYVVGGRPWRVLASVRGLAGVLVAVALAQSVLAPSGAPFLAVRNVTVLTTGGIHDAGMFLLRAVAVFLSGAIISAGAPGQLVAGLERLRVPAEIVFMTYVGIRFLPMLRRDTNDLRAASQLRGMGARTPAPLRGLAVAAHLLPPLVRRVLRRAHAVSLAAEARAYRLHADRTQRYMLRFTRTDTMLSLLSIAGVTLLIVLQLKN